MLAVVFAISAVGKLRNRIVRSAFRASLRDMALLPAAVVGPVAVAVPIGEALAVVLLVIPTTATVGCGLAFALLAAFTTGVAIVLRHGTAASCLCFGTSARPYGGRHLARNVFLGGIALTGSVLAGSSVETPALVVAILAGSITALVVITFDELLDLLSSAAQ